MFLLMIMSSFFRKDFFAVTRRNVDGRSFVRLNTAPDEETRRRTNMVNTFYCENFLRGEKITKETL